METEKRPACRIFAHRGASCQAPENTGDAFDKALEYAIDGIETDVQMSQDNIPVLWHDRTLERLGLPDRRVDDFVYEPLRQLCRTARRNAFELMSLAEFLAAYRGRCGLDIEVKNRDWESRQRQEQKMRLAVHLIKRSEVEDVFISSFKLGSLIFAHQLTDQIPYFYILDDHHTLVDIDTALRHQLFLTGFCIPIQLINDKMVQNLRAFDKKIVTYTCNSRDEIRRAIGLGVDIIITDDPQQALSLRDT